MGGKPRLEHRRIRFSIRPPEPEDAARYAFEYEPIDDPQGRTAGVFGARLRLVDRQGDALLAEYERYVLAGVSVSGRVHRTWAHLQACPLEAGNRRTEIASFARSVLKPREDR